MCNGASLTGRRADGPLPLLPGQSGYCAMQDPYGLGYFGFTENPVGDPGPEAPDGLAAAG